MPVGRCTTGISVPLQLSRDKYSPWRDLLDHLHRVPCRVGAWRSVISGRFEDALSTVIVIRAMLPPRKRPIVTLPARLLCVHHGPQIIMWDSCQVGGRTCNRRGSQSLGPLGDPDTDTTFIVILQGGK